MENRPLLPNPEPPIWALALWAQDPSVHEKEKKEGALEILELNPDSIPRHLKPRWPREVPRQAMGWPPGAGEGAAQRWLLPAGLPVSRRPAFIPGEWQRGGGEGPAFRPRLRGAQPLAVQLEGPPLQPCLAWAGWALGSCQGCFSTHPLAEGQGEEEPGWGGAETPALPRPHRRPRRQAALPAFHSETCAFLLIRNERCPLFRVRNTD